MKTVTVREVRNEFAKIEAWIADGQTVEVLRKGVPVARLVAPVEKTESPWAGVDIEARLKRTSGDRMLTQEDLDAITAFENEGQEG